VTELLARLGNVLYWLCTGVAALFVLVGILSALPHETVAGVDEESLRYAIVVLLIGRAGVTEENLGYAAVTVGAAIVVWLIGRVVRYILAGK